jgi:GNAT superfamily N-acetyltransferase
MAFHRMITGKPGERGNGFRNHNELQMVTGLTIHSSFQHDRRLRESFFGLAHASFSVRLDEWYQRGYWSERCIPYAAVSGDEVVACLLAHRLDITWGGILHQAIQLGTIATRPDWRGRGAARALIEQALHVHAPDVDFFFLFAHSSVADFYPRIGFTQMAQSRFFLCEPLPLVKKTGLAGWPRATLDSVEAVAGGRAPVSSIAGVSGDRHLLLFHCLESFPEHIFNLGDCLVIAKLDGDTLHLIDVIARDEPVLPVLLPRILLPQVNRVEFHFTPGQSELCIRSAPLDDPDTILFVLPMIDPPSAVFRFPLTAQA